MVHVAARAAHRPTSSIDLLIAREHSLRYCRADCISPTQPERGVHAAALSGRRTTMENPRRLRHGPGSAGGSLAEAWLKPAPRTHFARAIATGSREHNRQSS